MVRARSTQLLAVALLALVVRLVYIWQISHAPFFDLRLGDALAYHEWALRIAGGNWLGHEVFYQAPLYPYCLAVVYRVLGDGAAMVRFVQALAGTGSCVLVAAAGIALFGEYGALAGALLAVYPPAIFLDGLLEKSALVTLLTAALLYLLADRQARARRFLAGVVLGLLSLTRENALLLAIPMLLWFLVEEWPRGARRAWLRVLTCLAGCSLVLLPVGARNFAVGRAFHLTTSQFGPNFYIGNHEGARGLYAPLVERRGNAGVERDDAARLAEDASGRSLGPDEVSSYWTGRALAFIRARPGAWIRLLARKLALTYNAVEIADTESQDVYAEWSSLLRAFAPFTFGVLLCLAAFGAGATAPAWRRLWFLYGMALTYTVSIVMFYVFARYRLPLVPILTLFAAGGAASWREAGARHARRWGLAAAGLAATLAYLPLEDARADRLAHYVNIGNAFLVTPERWDHAAVYYGKALRESPQSPDAHFGMGMLLAQQHRSQDALAHYRTAASGQPDNADIKINLGLALADVGDGPGALDQFEAAGRLRPDDPTADLIAGKFLLTHAKPGEALEAYRRALAIQPRQLDALMGSGLALSQLERLDDAAEMFRRALEVAPNDPDAQQALRAVQAQRNGVR